MFRRITGAALALALALLCLPAVPAQAQDEVPLLFLQTQDINAVYTVTNHVAVTIGDPDQLLQSGVVPAGVSEFVQLNNTLQPEPVEAPAQPGPVRVQYIVELQDAGLTTVIYSLYDNSLLRVDNEWYAVRPAAHSALQTLWRQTSDNGFMGLLFTNRMVVDTVSWQRGGDRGRNSLYYTHDVYDLLRKLRVQAGGTVEWMWPDTWNPQQDDLLLWVTFRDSDLEYELFVRDRYLYLYSNKMSHGLRFTLVGGQDGARVLLENLEDIDNMIPVDTANPEAGKPVIYLYPTQTMDVQVALDFQGFFHTTLPAYNGGWDVVAQPDGTLTDKNTGRQYPYLFWDGNPWKTSWDFSSGFVVPGGEIEAFLRDRLPQLGLTPGEYEEFIDYWVPMLEHNPYNLITFQFGEFGEVAPLTISPRPRTLWRVHMIWAPLSEPVDIPAQQLPTPPERDGFTVIEWGGTRALDPVLPQSAQ